MEPASQAAQHNRPGFLLVTQDRLLGPSTRGASQAGVLLFQWFLCAPLQRSLLSRAARQGVQATCDPHQPQAPPASRFPAASTQRTQQPWPAVCSASRHSACCLCRKVKLRASWGGKGVLLGPTLHLLSEEQVSWSYCRIPKNQVTMLIARLLIRRDPLETWYLGRQKGRPVATVCSRLVRFCVCFTVV